MWKCVPGVPIGTWADWDLLLEARSLLERLVCAGNFPPSPTPTPRLVIHEREQRPGGSSILRQDAGSLGQGRLKYTDETGGVSQAEAYGGCGETEERGGEEPTSRDARRVPCGTAESLYRTLETHTTRCVKYTGIKRESHKTGKNRKKSSRG